MGDLSDSIYSHDQQNQKIEHIVNLIKIFDSYKLPSTLQYMMLIDSIRTTLGLDEK